MSVTSSNVKSMSDLYCGAEGAISIEKLKYRLLIVLRDNLASPSPQLVSAYDIAERLHIKITETKDLLKALHGTGEIVTDLDGQYSLLTSEGLAWLNSKLQ